MDCFYCKKDERLAALMLPLAELPYSDVYLFRDQKHYGRCVVALKGHCDEIFQMTHDQRNSFFSDVSLVAEAVASVTTADKINYAIYGDKVSHFHVHIVPKLEGQLQWGEPFTDKLPSVMLSEAEYDILAGKLMSEMKKLSEEKYYCQMKQVYHTAF